MPTDVHDIETKLWAAADELRANSRLKASEYSIPVLGLIFLRYADKRFADLQAQLAGKGSGRRRVTGNPPADACRHCERLLWARCLATESSWGLCASELEHGV